ncbi:hypothetical protein [Absidia glauca]|uniref:Uncharacterized protein n=1 Tax=Absidia glauca TaxID=4829 RepID=A0A163J7K1_ABSGL|nr:hypothetical protein [Absidia glauca]
MEEEHLRKKSSTLTRSSSFVEDCRDARTSAAKEFDQFYGYLANALSPRRSDLDQRRSTSSSSLTPMMDRHSLLTGSEGLQFRDRFEETDIEDRCISSPTSRSQYKYHPPPRPMTLSPNTIPTCRSDDNVLSQKEGRLESADPLDHSTAANTYLPSPHRSTIARSPPRSTFSTTPFRPFQSSSSPLKVNRTPGSTTTLCPSSPSVVLRDKLVDETRRLEQLQHNILLVQQQSFALTGSSKIPKNVSSVGASTQLLFTDENSGKRHTHPFTATIKSTTPTRPDKASILPTPPTSVHSLQSDRKLARDFEQIPPPPPPPPPIFTTSTPLGSPTVPHRPLHPVFSTQPQKSQMSSISPPPTAMHNTPSGLIPSSSPIPPPPSTCASKLPRTSPQGQQKALLRDVLNDIPKARLRCSKIITTPKGSRIKNKVWDEIHPTTSAGDEEDLFWMNDNNEQRSKSHLTHRLQHVKTLEEELYLANDKCAKQQEQQNQGKKNQLKAQMFSLKPNPSHLIDEEVTTAGRLVVGDQWTFGGQHYILQEKG